MLPCLGHALSRTKIGANQKNGALKRLVVMQQGDGQVDRSKSDSQMNLLCRVDVTMPFRF